jgi:multiple sugar transport system substrate-binding protein
MMFNRKRGRSLPAALAIGILAAVTGFGGASRAAPGDPVTLVIANSQWLDALRGKSLWEALLKYRKVAPNVTLQQEAIPLPVFGDRMTTEFGAGQGPDIAIMQDALFFAIADAGFLVPLDKAVEKVTNLNVTNDSGIVKGKRLGIAWQRAVYAFIYNKPLIESAGAKVPTDLKSLIATGKAVTAATGAIGFTGRHQMNEFAFWALDFQNWAYGYGVNWVDNNGKLKVDSPEAVAAVTAFKQLYDAGLMPTGDDMATQRSRFKEKKAAFSIENSGSALNIVSGGALATADLMAAPLPFEHPGAHQQLFISLSRHSKNQQAAMDFMAWLVSADGQQALRDASGPDALATDVPVTESFRAANPWADTYAKLAVNSRSALIPGYEVKTTQIMRSVMEAVERVLIGGVDPKKSLAEAQQQISTKF